MFKRNAQRDCFKKVFSLRLLQRETAWLNLMTKISRELTPLVVLQVDSGVKKILTQIFLHLRRTTILSYKPHLTNNSPR
jgi:hypothetical protein